uniref:Stabilization protein n=1 Tax=Siphoviridae sp. ct0X023 TaxID=2825295 RepID=A0A8S5P2M6_9CAUD|nr:MAG TPA: stabilization protein [Siphoviridae sp. ct0X023]
MIRCAFNGGELSPTSAVRADLDNFHRGASRIENLDLGQMGGVSRRRGFRRVAAALEGSVILPYVYSTNDRFLVEVSPSLLRVLSAEGDVVASLPSVWSQDDVSALRHKQVNSMLFLACPTHELMVLKRDDEGMFSLAPYEFKARPWRYEEFRDFPVRLTLDEGCYRVSFGEHASDADAAVNEGDVMRVQVTVPQQTGFSTGAVIRQGWVIAKAFTAASSYAAGRKLCINEGSYWSWWTCDRDFNGAADFVDGLTSPADYPEHFHKGVICHSNTITCKGTWTFYCYKEWYGTYAVERRFPNEDWQLLGTSNSPVGAASNLQLTGDEAGEECYLRLMLYESQLSNGSDPSQGFPADSCGNKLVVDAYKKDVVLRLHSLSTSDVRKLTLPLGSDFCDFFEKKGLPFFSALLVDGAKVDGGFEVSREGRTLTVKPDGLTTDDVGAGSMVRLEWEQAEVSLDRFAEGSIEIYRFFLPAGTVVSMQGFVCVYAGQTIQLNSTLNVCSFCEGNGGSYSWMPVFSTMEKASFTVPEDGVYAVRMETWPGGSVSQRARAQLEAPACTAWMEAEAAEVAASAEYSLWDNISAVPEGVPPSGESLMWSFAAFRGVYGFPSLVDVFQQRLVLAATQAQPQTVWLSKTDDLNSFEVGKQDDSALALTLSTTTQNRICWLMAQSSRLLLGTADAEWAVSGGQGVMTYSNARADSHGFVGSSDVPALMATDKVLYVERGGGRVYQYGYDYESDGFVSRDLTVFADHVLADGGGCRGVAFVRKPEPRAVFVRRDGVLALMTYNSMHQVHAWHRYTTDGVFEGVAVLPNGDQADLLFALVSREDGRFIEVLAPGNEFQDPGGRDFVSVLETNALISLEAAGRRQHSGGVMFFFGSDALVDGVEVSIDGTRWDVLDRSPSSFLTRGWHSLVADGCWNYDSMVGIRVSGNRDFNLLAIQA